MSSGLHQYDFVNLKLKVIESIAEVLLRRYGIQHPNNMIGAIVRDPSKVSDFDDFKKIPAPRASQILFIFSIICQLEQKKELSEECKNKVLSASVFYVIEDIRFSYNESFSATLWSYFTTYNCTNSRLFTQLSQIINLNQTVMNNLAYNDDKMKHYNRMFKMMYDDLSGFLSNNSNAFPAILKDPMDIQSVLQTSTKRSSELESNPKSHVELSKDNFFYKKPDVGEPSSIHHLNLDK